MAEADTPEAKKEIAQDKKPEASEKVAEPENKGKVQG